ncbi:MAG: leucyl aminopeptidase [Synergistaceae bacterium]
MRINRLDKTVNIKETEVTAILITETENLELALLGAETAKFIKEYALTENFTGKAGTILSMPYPSNPSKKIILAGLGKKKANLNEEIRTATFNVVKTATTKENISITIYCDNATDKETSKAIAEGATFATYKFDKYILKEKDEHRIPEEINIYDANLEGINEGLILAEAQCYAKDIANEPGNIITPQTLAAKALALADEENLECEIWNEEKIINEKMGAYTAVARGSANAPRFIQVTYKPDTKEKGHIVLIGKGLTFDSGGLDIKPADYMTTMKGDKSGACAVLGAIKAISKLKPSWKVTVIIAAAENMPGGRAYRPDDILTARNGKTIEVNNTDAEGRLTLADALAYASELKPNIIVDIATLTGACAVALGTNTAGLFTNDDKLGEKIIASGKSTGERYWKLPLDDPELRKSLKSPFADLVNCGERYGGAITAAMFLEEFVAEEIKWAHLDIAAADFIKTPKTYYSKGASGFGTRTLISLIMQL